MPELTAPFVMKDDEKRIVYGPVLVPDEADSDGDTVTAEKIEEVAHQFVEDYGNIDLMHSLNNVGKMIESYILPMDLPVDENLTVPKGSWMMGVRVTDDESWEAVKSGTLGGFSIMGISKVATKSAEKKTAEKRTTLADLGEDWIVNAVSLVDEPAVPKAKFIAIKSKKKHEEITADTVKKAIQGSLEHRKQLVRNKVYSTFDSNETDSYVHSTLDDSVIVRITDYFTETQRMVQLGYAIDEQGNVEFTTAPQEVRIEESVVPVESNSVTFSKDDDKEINTAEKSEEGVFAKLMKKLGFNSSEKAGRTISDANYQKLKAAKEVIDELLAVGEKERSNKAKAGDEDMKQEDVEKLIAKSMEPVNSKLDDLMNTLKAEAKGDDKGQDETNPSEKSKDDNENTEDNNENGTDSTEKGKGNNDSVENDKEDDNEDKVSKSEYEKVLEELEKAKKRQPFSRRLAGQDNMAEKADKYESDRDAFGYKRKAK